MHRHLRPNMIDTAKELRSNATASEKRLWEQLRNRKLDNLKFRRQHQIGTYIVDFYCAELRLIIEVDGSVHFSEEAQFLDQERETSLRKMGHRMLRFSNGQVQRAMEDCLAEIRSLAMSAAA